MATTIGSLAVSILARVAPFTKGMKQAQGATRSFSQRIQSTGKSLLNFGSVITGISFGGLAMFAKQQLDALDALGKLSDKLGVSTENLAAWHHGAEKAGLSAEALDRGLGAMVRNVGKFAEAGGPAAKRLEALGFSFAELGALKSDEMFTRVADRIRALPTLAEKSAAAFEIFGKSGQDLMPILQAGSAGLAAMRKEGDALGITFSRQQAEKVGQFNDAMDDLKGLIGGLGQQFVISIAPAAIAGIKLLSDTVRAMQEMKGMWGSFVSETEKTLAGAGEALTGRKMDPKRGGMRDIGNVVGESLASANLGFGRREHKSWLQKPVLDIVAQQKALGYLDKMARASEKGMATRYAIP
jgi:hypothetical protein